MQLSKETYEALIKELNQHAYYYYVKDAPIISDSDYDKKYQLLVKFEEQNPLLIDPSSPTQRIGDQPLDKFDTFQHPTKLPSLNNLFNVEELDTFYERLLKQTSQSQLELTIEPKIDGLAIALHYENGKLKVAATRGNGEQGEIVTHNIKTIKTIPLQLPTPITAEIRGEVFMKKSIFKKSKSRDNYLANTRDRVLEK